MFESQTACRLGLLLALISASLPVNWVGAQNFGKGPHTWILRYNSNGFTYGGHRLYERQGERAITRRYLVETKMEDRLATTNFVRTIFNPTNQPMVVELSVGLPTEAVITKIDINGEPQIVPNPSFQENRTASLVENKTAICSEASDFSKFELFVVAGPLEEFTFNFTYQHLILKRRAKFLQKVYLSPGEIVEDFLVSVSIKDPDPIQSISFGAQHIASLEDHIQQSQVDGLHTINLRLDSVSQAAFGQRGFSGFITVDYTTLQRKLWELEADSAGRFIHTISLPHMPSLHQNLILVLPSTPRSAAFSTFFHNLIIGCSERLSPADELAVLKTNHDQPDSVLLNTHSKSDLLNRLVVVDSKVQRLRIVEEDKSETWVDLQPSLPDPQAVVAAVFGVELPVLKNIRLSFGKGVNNESLSTTQFDLLYNGQEIKVSGDLEALDLSNNLPSKILFGLQGLSDKGVLTEQIEMPVQPKEANQDTFLKKWWILKYRSALASETQLTDQVIKTAVDQGILCEMTSAKTRDGSHYKHSDLVTRHPSTQPACKRVEVARLKSSVDQPSSTCHLTLALSKAEVRTVSESTPQLSFSTTQVTAPIPHLDASSSLTSHRTNLFLASLRASLPLTTGNLNLRQALKNIRNKSPPNTERRQPRSSTKPNTERRQPRSSTKPNGPAGNTKQNIIKAKVEGECCWILFSSENYQGKRETLCKTAAAISLPTVKSLQRI